jgi:uncharacterized membrane protein YeaQ/YmgE (transglycosylase-associated protein family)
MGRNRSMGLILNIVVGIAGSALGGGCPRFCSGGAGDGLQLAQLPDGVAGSCLLLAIFGGIGKKRK